MTKREAKAAVSGLLLAGGQSRRMGGGDKGLKDLGGKPMLAHVIERMRPQVASLVINANGDPGRFAQFGLPVIPDTVEGQAGPLAGMLAGLKWSASNAPDTSYVASVSTDAPFLPTDLVQRLLEALANRPNSVAVASSGGELHPVIGLWPVALADDMATAIESGVRKVLAFTDLHGTVPVPFPLLEIHGHRIDPFFNANTPEELDEARALLQA